MGNDTLDLGGLDTVLSDVTKSLRSLIKKFNTATKAQKTSARYTPGAYGSVTTRGALKATMAAQNGIENFLHRRTGSALPQTQGSALARATNGAPAADDISPARVLLSGFGASQGQMNAALAKLVARGQRHL